jgi:ElaB/YqjD/DUF883 family membrane-anchored ribosome-binding protein
MANTVFASTSTPTGASTHDWKNQLQARLETRLIVWDIFEVDTSNTYVHHNPYQSTSTATNSVVSSPAYTVADFSITEDSLTVNKRAYVSEHVDNYDELFSRYDLAMERAKEHADRIKKTIDKDSLQTVTTTSGIQLVDNATLGGAAGNITLSTSNIDEVFDAARIKLDEADVDTDGELFAVLRPKDISKLRLFASTAGFNTADETFKNGKVGRYMGFDIYMSNNLYTNGGSAYPLFGAKKSAFIALPESGIGFEAKSVSGKFGKEIVSHKFHNSKVWNNNLPKLVKVQVTA